MQINIFTEITS